MSNANIVRSLLYAATSQSHDPDTQVGAVARTVSGTWLVAGNRLPEGIAYDPALCERPAKYQWLEHAERALVYRAAAVGVSLAGATMYLSWYPCVDCARALVAVGFKRVYCQSPDFDHPRWGDEFKVAQAVLAAGGLEVRELEEALAE